VRYLARNVAWGSIVIALVMLTVFVVSRIVSDPVRRMLDFDATDEQVRAVTERLGLDESILQQLWLYVTDVITLDFGTSYWQNRPVMEMIFERLPNTLVLVLAGMLIAVAIGIPLGVAASLRPGGWLDQITSSVALLGLSLPQFWLGAMLILLFAVTLGWLPTSGRGGPEHLVLPVIAIALPTLGRIVQVTRTSMIDVLASPYILAAKAKGLSDSYVIARHALRNAFIPIFTLTAFETAYTIAGTAVVVEVLFAWPGVNYLAMQALQRQDLLLVQGVVLVMAIIVVVINLLLDVSYRFIDPRIRLR
jgi:peptide/nickel transport system permease protein